jgi:hypothetical protein
MQMMSAYCNLLCMLFCLRIAVYSDFESESGGTPREDYCRRLLAEITEAAERVYGD